MAKILILHGPNLNLLGQREPHLYGTYTLNEIDAHLKKRANGHLVECFQSNAEHDLVQKIQLSVIEQVDFIIINPAAFTHTSIAIRDALLAVNLPFIEVHLTNPLQREFFRHHSYLSDIALGVISGLGAFGYYAALEAALLFLQNQS